MRLNLVCKREKPRDVIPGSKRSPARDLSSSPSSTSSAKSSGQYSCLSLSISRAPDTSRLGDFLTSNKGQGRRLMLTYYTQVLAGLLTTNHDNNSFLTGVIESSRIIEGHTNGAYSFLAHGYGLFTSTEISHSVVISPSVMLL